MSAGRRRAIPVRARPALVMLVASVAGVAMFLWPLLISPGAGAGHDHDAPLVFVFILPVLICVVLAELSSDGMDAKAVAMLGVLTALGAAMRPLGAGTAGIETVFFTLILGGRVFGAGFGFVLGSTTMFASALLTGSVGPWLPFQMLAASWTGMLAGTLPRRVTGRAEIALLAAYGVLAAYAFGFLLNLWFWPFGAGPATSLSHIPGAAVVTNLHRFVLYTLATSTWGWDTGRAITNVVAIAVLGPSVLGALRRASRRAGFDAVPEFVDLPGV